MKKFPPKWYVLLEDFNEKELELASKFRLNLDTDSKWKSVIEGHVIFNFIGYVISNFNHDGSLFYADSDAIQLTKSEFLQLIN